MIYIYPQNLKSIANIWLWSMKDFLISAICLLLSAFILVKLKSLLPMAATLCFAFLTIRSDEKRIADFIHYAFSYFLSSQQSYIWRN